MTRGFSGFDGKYENELVAGVVRGYRTWDMMIHHNLKQRPVPSLGRGGVRGLFDLVQDDLGSFVPYETIVEVEHKLVGAWSYHWNPGENVAECRPFDNVELLPLHTPPGSGCGCGFWAYWDGIALSGGWGFVSGVIEGYGKTKLGDKGFRCQKARIIALTINPRMLRASEYITGLKKLSNQFQVPFLPDVGTLIKEYPADNGGLI